MLEHGIIECMCVGVVRFIPRPREGARECIAWECGYRVASLQIRLVFLSLGVH